MTALAPLGSRDWHVFLLPWAVVFAVALCIDRWLAELLAPNFFAMKLDPVVRGIEHGGRTWFAICVMVVLAALHPRHVRAALLVFASSLVGGMLGAVLKWLVGRSRPVAEMVVDIRPFEFEFVRGGLPGLLEQKNLCFPSGHAIQVFALAACLSLLFPRGRFAWYALALVVASQRVIELAHYPSDVVGGALVGVFAFSIAARLTGADGWQARPDAPAPQGGERMAIPGGEGR